MAALKCILSLKEWLFKTFYEENLIKIIVLATEDDIRSNAKYISLSDKVIKVPPGKNINNYANVPLIVDIAKKEKVDAVWPGWGHSSENPLLSTLLEQENIIFIGPTGKVMEALGDKISANILAQSVNVPVVKWSGDDIKIKDFENNISEDIYNEATVHSLEECIKECKRIGFPVMIKASQGGGGKGIRKVENENEIKKAYEQVQNELPNSPIFLMKVCNNVRHIEIQVVGDMYGNVCSLSGRDCTTQRRFQKIFEEGPPLIVPPDIFREMEKSSIRLTKMIKYRGAGTIEYLYDQVKKKYYFLELNPRLQVEHPVSEGITNSNLISIQLQVAMGIPLQNIDDIKKLYKIEEKINKNISNIKTEGKREYNELHVKNSLNNNSSVSSMSNASNINTLKEANFKDIQIFDFYNNRPYVNNYVIAARITAENSNDSFKPTSGKVKRINFQNSNDVWGYFSINDGFVHEFSDSQIGHIFAKGETREIARKNLILSLRKLNIDGEIKTVTKYLAKILESKAFIDNNITTSWLDTIIKEKKNVYYNTYHIIILCATIFKLIAYFMSEKEKVEDNLSRDDIGIKTENGNTSNLKKKMKNPYIFDMVFENVKYCFKGYNIGENLYKLEINGQEIEVLAEYDKENNKILSSFQNKTYIYTCSEDSLGIHMNIEKDNIFIPKLSNPFHLISNTNGKIVKYLINNGEEVKKNEDYVEVEAMKMIMTFKSTETGILKHKKSEGSIIKIGDLLGIIEKGENSKSEDVNEIELFKGHLDLSNKYAYELKDSLFSSEVKQNNENNKDNDNINNNNNNNIDFSIKKIENVKANEENKVAGKISCNMNNLHKSLTKDETIDVNEIKNSDNVIYEEEEEMSSREKKKKRLFLKQKKKIFRLFSRRNQNEKKIMPINYLNNKLNYMRTHLTNINAPNDSSLPNNSSPNGNSTINDVINISTNYNSINSDSMNNWVSNNSMESDLTNDNISFDNATNNNINHNILSSEIVSTRNTSNEKTSNNDASNERTTNNNTVNHNSSNDNSTNSYKLNDNQTDSNAPTNNKFLLDIPNMKRIEYLLKGYEQDHEKCFNNLLKEDNFVHNVNYILDKFIEYNSLFSKKENITEVEIYDILYSSISDKKKQYEIIHAYTYNYLSIQFVEMILSHLVNNKETRLLSQILDKIKILEKFKGKLYGNIILLSRLIMHLNNHRTLNEYLKRAFNYNIIEENKKKDLITYMKNNNINYSKFEELLNNNNYEKITEIFLKDSNNIHMFVPSLSNHMKNHLFLKMYLNNLYKYFYIKSIPITDNILKFSINNSEFNNILILNENNTLNINNILKEELKTDIHLNNIHIINKNDHFFNSLENNLNALLRECNNLYVYNYSMNSYGEIYEWNKTESGNLTNTDGKNEEILNLLPFEKHIFSFTEIFKNYKLKNISEKKRTKTKLFLGLYKNDNKSTSLFAQKLIDISDLKELNKYKIQKLERNDRKEIENNVIVEEKKLIYDDFILELKESLNEIEIGRMNPLIKENKISSHIIYSIIIDNIDEINDIKEIYKNFLTTYNELLIQNYVNDVYIRIYSKLKREDIENGPKLKLEKLLKLHVLFDNEKNIIEEIDNYNFNIDTLYLKRKRARDTDTLYAYDFIKLINISLNRMNKTLNDNFNYINSIKEFKLSYITEKNSNEDLDEKKGNSNDSSLFENYDNLSDYEIKIKKSLYLSNKLELGQNKMSVIGLLMNIKTDEYKKGRDVVFIINDITTYGGSFSILEDELFYGISSYAREKKIPRIYVSCNSGARIGLYNFLMDKIKVNWKDEKKKELGYNYIYITEDVKNKMAKEDIVFLREIVENNEKRYIIDGIVGNLKNPIGVENLRGSGLIAGETSKAYEEIFTLSYVTGRSVGIGAYLVRLGKRTIQKKGSSLLLTGFNALNKLLGEKVYVSNEQLGGVKIMMRNGISQLEVQDDQDGVDKIIKWLTYIPKTSNDYYDIIEREQEEYANESVFTRVHDNVAIQENEKKHKEKNDVINLDTGIPNNMEEISEKENKRTTEYLRSENKRNNEYVKTIDHEKNNINFYIKKINDIDEDDLDNTNIIDLIKGTDTKQGFLDKNSYFEYMNEWGKGIITGRGKLGSIPVGFIAVNKNLVTQVIPCDPVLKTKSVKSPQAPCVFFPDNSYKTAQSIEDFNKENLPLFVFANWRGFSGGSMDMFNSILKFGSMIVNQLVNYKHPVFVYIPIFGELRGGSWVVVDEMLNSQIIEMYADTTSKGGVLEPPGIVEIKFRFPEIRKLMHNIDSSIIELNQKLLTAQEEEKSKIKKEIEEKEKELLPFYMQVCHKYADLHDVSTCMKSKGVIKKIIPWKKSRSFFYYRLLRRLLIKILNKKYGNSLMNSDEIKKIIDDIDGSEEDDYEACRKILNRNTLKNIKNAYSDLLYKKTLNDFYSAFKILSEEQKTQLLSQISSYKL